MSIHRFGDEIKLTGEVTIRRFGFPGGVAVDLTLIDRVADLQFANRRYLDDDEPQAKDDVDLIARAEEMASEVGIHLFKARLLEAMKKARHEDKPKTKIQQKRCTCDLSMTGGMDPATDPRFCPRHGNG